jgi:hypothetical protein
VQVIDSQGRLTVVRRVSQSRSLTSPESEVHTSACWLMETEGDKAPVDCGALGTVTLERAGEFSRWGSRYQLPMLTDIAATFTPY